MKEMNENIIYLKFLYYCFAVVKRVIRLGLIGFEGLASLEFDFFFISSCIISNLLFFLIVLFINLNSWTLSIFGSLEVVIDKVVFRRTI